MTCVDVRQATTDHEEEPDTNSITPDPVPATGTSESRIPGWFAEIGRWRADLMK